MEYRVVSPGAFFNATMRAFVLLFAFAFAFSIISIPASAAVKRAYAGIVVDAKSGKVLYSRAADAQRYPASITKVMTLYVLFQELDAGRIKLSTRMRVSSFAAAAVPSKLYLKVGTTISVENAIKALVTKSANDVARVISEHISGSEAKFAVRMTKVAKALGMSRTTYRNASGLPDSKQITTVRDQSRLGIAIFQHFPTYYKYFQTRSFKYMGRSYGNHNRLLGQNGIDGIKTGYIRASGYNLLTAARKNNRHIVVVAFGFDSGTRRNAKVAALVSTYMPKARRGNYVAHARISKPGIGGIIRVAAVPVTPMPRPGNRLPATRITVAAIGPAPAPRPVNLIAQTVVAPIVTQVASRPAQQNASAAINAVVAPIPLPKPEPIDVIGAWISQSLSLPPENSNGMLLPPIAIGGQGQTIDLLTSGSTGSKVNAARQGAPETGNWIVQVGTSSSEGGARLLISNASKRYAPLKDRRPVVLQSDKNGRTIYRARFVGFGDADQAEAVCNQLKTKEVKCLAVRS